MQEHLINLFQYNNWANRRVFAALPEVVDRDPSILVLFSHVIMVEKLWLGRISGSRQAPALWDPIPLPELWHCLNGSAQLWLDYLQKADADELERSVAYVNTKGVAYQNRVAEIAIHLVNHGSHHRGQILLLIRKLGISPPLIDFIAYARNE